MEDYIGIMKKSENMCRSYLLKAEQERIQSGGVHTKAECVYLQEAAKIRGEMARMSMGAEKQHQLDLKSSLDVQIRRIVSELSPEVFNKDKTSGTGSTAKGSNSSAVSDKTVASWYVNKTTHGFDSVAGMPATINHLRDCTAQMQHAKLRSYFKMSNTHGFLLFGPPGCGKTFLATAFAHELMQKDYKYMKLEGADILSKYVGEAESIIKRLFDETLKNAPCIVFIDEFESVCKNRSREGLPEYAFSITTAFLDGFNKIADRTSKDGEAADKTIIFIGATNYPNLVDDAMVDRMGLIRIPLPDKEARAAIAESKFRGILKLEEGFTFDEIAEMTEQYSIRDIDRIVEAIKVQLIKDREFIDDTSTIKMFKSGEDRLKRTTFLEVQKKFIPSPKDNILREQEEWEKRLCYTPDI